MKNSFILLLNLLLISAAFGQNKAVTKLYFYCDPSTELLTVANQKDPIKISRCTLVETTLDSLGLKIFKNKTINIPLKAGHTYYFRRITSSYGGLASATLSACSEEDFWLNGYFSGMGTYRHYFLDKDAGLKLLAEEK